MPSPCIVSYTSFMNFLCVTRQKKKVSEMIKINGGCPATTTSCIAGFNNADYTHQYKVREIKSVKKKKNASITSVFSMSHHHWTQFERDCCRIALAAQEVTDGPCSDWEDI